MHIEMAITPLSALLCSTLLMANMAMASEQAGPSPDVYSVVERKLEVTLPLSQNTDDKSQRPYIGLYENILLHDDPIRAGKLLNKLDYKSKDARFYLDMVAASIATTGEPDKAMIFLSQMGLTHPSSRLNYKEYLDAWLRLKQPDKALRVLNLYENTVGKQMYLAILLEGYREDPDKAVAIYIENYGDREIEPHSQSLMLLAIAKNYQYKSESEKAISYAKKAEEMLINAKKNNASQKFIPQYIELIKIYSGSAQTLPHATELADALLIPISQDEYSVNFYLPELIVFYKNNGLTDKYKSLLLERIESVDKKFRFAPEALAESRLIDFLYQIGEQELGQARIDKFFNSAEYACYDSNYCYEYKIKSLKHLYDNQQDTLANQHLSHLVHESKNEPLTSWIIINQHIAEKLAVMKRYNEIKNLATDAEAIILNVQKEYPNQEFKNEYIDLVKIYSLAGDVENTEKVLEMFTTSSKNYYLSEVYKNNHRWDKLKAIILKDKMLDNDNILLLENICKTNNAECIEHITFTLSTLVDRMPMSPTDNSGNQQLYQIGSIFNNLKIKPTEQQQALIQTLYSQAATPKTSLAEIIIESNK